MPGIKIRVVPGVKSRMSHLHGLGGMAAHFLSSPQGQQMIRDYLSTPEGQQAVDAFLKTPHGQEMAILLLSRSLDGLDLPEETRESVRRALDGKHHHRKKIS